MTSKQSTKESIPAFRPIPKTGVIYIMSEASSVGFSRGNPNWVNLGQGAPETTVLPNSHQRIQDIHIHSDSFEYSPVDGITQLR
jgi:hypothetical protein